MLERSTFLRQTTPGGIKFDKQVEVVGLFDPCFLTLIDKLTGQDDKGSTLKERVHLPMKTPSLRLSMKDIKES